MGKKIWIWLFAAAVSAGASSCSRDQAAGGSDSGEPVAGESSYIAFQLTETDSDTNTRASSIHKEYDDEYAHYEWFNRGSKQERAITDDPECNRVLFFWADNSYYGSGKLEKTEKENIFLGKKPSGTQLSPPPTQFLVVVNGDPDRLDRLDTELAAAGTDALKAVLNYLQELDLNNPESYAMHEGYFTMTSSMYQTEEDQWLAGVTEKSNFQFYDTIEEALLPENLLQFYVDRVVAKVTLRIQDGELSFGKNDALVMRGPNSLKVRLEYQVEDGQNKDAMSGWSASLVNWGINGVEKNTYLFKTLAKAPESYPWRVGDFYSRWSEYRLFRSYWAIDENYDTGIYPDQFRQALDEDGVSSATTNTIYSAGYDPAGGLELDDYTLIYRSYNAFGTRADDKYSVENTFDESLLTEKEMETRPWLRCGTHVIVTAQLLVDALDADVDTSAIDEHGFLQGVADKFFSNGLWWSEKALIEQAVATLLSNIYYNKETFPIRNVLGEGDIEFIDNDPDNPLDDNTPLVAADGTVITSKNAVDYFELAPAFIKGGDGWVTIRLKEGKQLKALHYDGSQTDISQEQLVSYIYRFTNLAKHYKEGRMYYALPIKHNVDSKNFDTGDKVSTGDYGVVRNHWYRLTIRSVMLPGTPVDDPDQPIIPNNEPEDKSLGIDIEVIPWHIVEIYVDKLQ